MTGTKTTSGFTMLWATEEMVNEHPISADTSAINDIESGAVCTIRAKNPAFFEAVSRDSRRIEPGSAGSVTQFSDSNSINRTESLDANGWSLDMATRKFSSAINLDVIPSGGTVHRTIRCRVVDRAASTTPRSRKRNCRARIRYRDSSFSPISPTARRADAKKSPRNPGERDLSFPCLPQTPRSRPSGTRPESRAPEAAALHRQQ